MIGVFDSGVGGLSVLSEIRAVLPDADLLYVADRARAPYGTRSLDEVRQMAREITDWLLGAGAEVVVIACNTASAAALESLRADFPGVPFVGMEPAVKPASAATRSGVIGVLATSATFQGRLFESVVNTHAVGIEVVATACPEWVTAVEAGAVDGADTETLVAQGLTPALERGADTLVLGCTHFSFLAPVIGRVAGPGVSIIDPVPAVAAQTARLTPAQRGSGRLSLAGSGDLTELVELASSVANMTATGRPLRFPA